MIRAALPAIVFVLSQIVIGILAYRQGRKDEMLEGYRVVLNRIRAVERMRLPSDYEPCGECGFDHSYEPDEAFRAHRGKEI